MIHAFQVHGQRMVVDAYSCSVHVVDEIGQAAIRLYEHLPRPQALAQLQAQFPQQGTASLNEYLDEIDTLRQAGKLYAPDRYAQAAGILKQKNDVIKALCLHVAHTCNLTCSYCFAGQGRYHGRQALMPYEVGCRALDFLVAHSGSRRHLEVDFFGGEPLMNWDVVKRLVAYGRLLEKKHNKLFRFTLTTNGMLLDDEVTDFCNREMDNVVLSLDGRPQVHDRFRLDRAGRGSYQQVVPRFQRFAKLRAGKSYYMRGTFTRHNRDFLSDILHMADLGFTELSMEPVVAAADDPCALREEDLPRLYQQYEQLAQQMLTRGRQGKPFHFYHYNMDLVQGPCVYKRISGCGSGTEYLAVTPQGDLYPCHQFVGEEDFRLGSLEEGITRPDIREQFRACNAYSRPECTDCWAKLYCAGGCAANAYHASGDLRGVYKLGCDLFKKRIECVLWLKAMQSEGLDKNI